MKLYDFHVHSNFSDDSNALPEDMVKAAINSGLLGMCFTEHNDFDFPAENGKETFILKLNEYIENVKKLQESYSDTFPIYIGLEQGLMRSVSKKVNDYDTSNLDFVIGSSHLVNGEDPYYPKFWQEKNAHECIMAYYEGILDNLDCCTDFDVYGHIDYIIRYIPKNADGSPIYVYDERKYHDILDAILRKILSCDKGIEINTSGFKYGLSEPNPSKFILKRYRELGGEIITIGSDAHKPQHIAYDFKRVPDILKNAGFNYYCIFKSRKPEFIKLDV